jgi:gamma-glutamyl-gamma-aminobutyrate hydrolase PuuD
MMVEEHPFALAVQYHPEELVDSDPAALALFQAFVRACAERMAARAGK